MKSITLSDFEEVIKRDETSIIIFSAKWCAPCKTLYSIIDEYDPEGSRAIYKVDADEQSELATIFNVRGLPSVFKISEGITVDSFAGLPSRDTVIKFLESE